MADAMVTVTGELVGVVEETWKGYKRKDGTEAAGGSSRSVWVSPGFSHAPIELRVEDRTLFAQLAAEPFGSEIVAQCGLRAFARDGRAFTQFALVGWAPMSAAA